MTPIDLEKINLTPNDLKNTKKQDKKLIHELFLKKLKNYF